MKRTLLIVVFSLVLSGCQSAVHENSLSKKDSVEVKVISELLKPLTKRGIKIINVKKVASSEVPGFETYVVDLVDEARHREIRRFIFINPEKKLIALQIFRYSSENGSVVLSPLKPENAEKPLKIDVSFLKDVENKLSEANIPHVVGKGDKKVYIIWDVFCPFCYRHFSQLEEIAKKNNVEIHMIPLAVHGRNSLKGIVYYTKLAREKGVVGALKELYGMGGGNFMNYVGTLEKKLKHKEKIVEDQDRIEKTLKDTESILVKNGVRATPTLIYVPPGKEKGYIHVGFVPIEKLIKEAEKK